ncbi:hypothetical protein VHEMI07994 [[Torrubiella] hemipterigena]|uniref:Peptidase S1A alpha-lytic prodomain domain-containing protein n=1 Tax=[Torrubiella] hemipterigena TaxID=1531966 RepID=A0A0A1TC34_9HYPO|nr:hypothetical protein VHEMI07994 [[Torrubiella] hemipterigena]
MLEAIQRDLGLDTTQATARIARDSYASKVIENLQGSLGKSFSGAWPDEDKILVGITDEAQKKDVVSAGGTPVLMANSLDKLHKTQEALNDILKGHAKRDGHSTFGYHASIASYGVDLAANKLVINALAHAQDAANKFTSHSGLDASDYEVHVIDTMPAAHATVVGGYAYKNIDARLIWSYGFAVTGGFISAGHCGSAGAHVTSFSGEAVGTFYDSTYPGNDWSYVQTVQGTTLYGYVDAGNGNFYPVKGSQEAAVGATICRSGQTTGVRCGTIRQKNMTVNYREGTLRLDTDKLALITETLVALSLLERRLRVSSLAVMVLAKTAIAYLTSSQSTPF